MALPTANPSSHHEIVTVDDSTPPVEVGMLNCAPFCEYFDTGSTVGEPSNYSPGSGDRYYYFSTEHDAVVTLSLCALNTDFDTYLTLVEVTSNHITGGNVVATNNDGGDLWSRCKDKSEIEYATVKGRRYLIVVQGHANDEGNYGLRVTGIAEVAGSKINHSTSSPTESSTVTPSPGEYMHGGV
jgi:hypothetical protein